MLLRAELEYPTALFKETTMYAGSGNIIYGCWQQMVNNPGQIAAGDRSSDTDDEYQRIVVDWNQDRYFSACHDYHNLLLHQLFDTAGTSRPRTTPV